MQKSRHERAQAHLSKETNEILAEMAMNLEDILVLLEEQNVPEATDAGRAVVTHPEPEAASAPWQFLYLPVGSSAKTVRQTVLDLKGRQFVVEISFPVDGVVINQRIRARNLNELQSRAAPLVANARLRGVELQVNSLYVVN